MADGEHTYRECPFCKEQMREDASVCPHCRRESKQRFASVLHSPQTGMPTASGVSAPWPGWLKILGLLLAIVLVFTVCNQMLSGSSSTSSGGGADTSSDLACDHFRNIAADMSAGIMTVDEFREKLKEVEGNASIATPRIQEAATELLAAVTAGDSGDRFSAAVSEMGAACSEAGH